MPNSAAICSIKKIDFFLLLYLKEIVQTMQHTSSPNTPTNSYQLNTSSASNPNVQLAPNGYRNGSLFSFIMVLLGYPNETWRQYFSYTNLFSFIGLKDMDNGKSLAYSLLVIILLCKYIWIWILTPNEYRALLIVSQFISDICGMVLEFLFDTSLNKKLDDIRREMNDEFSIARQERGAMRYELEQAKKERKQAKKEREQAKLEREQAKKERKDMNHKLEQILNILEKHGALLESLTNNSQAHTNIAQDKTNTLHVVPIKDSFESTNVSLVEKSFEEIDAIWDGLRQRKPKGSQ